MEAFYTQKLLQKNHQSDEHFERPFSFVAVKGKLRNLPLLSLGAIFALVTAAHAQNLYVSANVPGGNHAIFEYTPTGTQSTYATGLDNPRGLAFDSIGNLFATTAHNADDIDLGKVLKFNPRNHVNTVGSAAHFFFE